MPYERLINRSKLFPFIYYSFSLRKIDLEISSHEKEIFFHWITYFDVN